MKVLYLHQYFNTPSMSGGTRSYEMARRLVNAGHEVHMITSYRDQTDKSTWFQSKVDGINIHWLPALYSNHMSYARRIRAFFNFAFAAGGYAKKIGGDIVFATSTPLTIAIPAIRASRALKVPMVFEVRDLWPELPIAIGALKNPLAKWLARLLERSAYQNATRVVALSPGMKEGVVSTGYPASNVSIIPNSADLELFYPAMPVPEVLQKQLQFAQGKTLVVYAGTLGAINGVSYLVKMARAAMDKHVPIAFLAIGDGVEIQKIENLAVSLGVLNNNFLLLPPVNKSEMPGVFAAADIICSLFIDLKPMWANSANKFFDGLSAGKAIAINYGGWQAELLNKTGAGVVLPPNDPVVGMQILADLASDKARLLDMGRSARELAEKDFSRDKLAAQLEQVLLDAVAEYKKQVR